MKEKDPLRNKFFREKLRVTMCCTLRTALVPIMGLRGRLERG